MAKELSTTESKPAGGTVTIRHELIERGGSSKLGVEAAMGRIHRCGTRQVVVGFCITSLMVLAFPISTDAGSAHKGQIGRTGTAKKAEQRAKQGTATLRSIRRCSCKGQALPSAGGTSPGSVRLPGLAHFRAVVGTAQGGGLRRQALWRRAAWQAIYGQRLMLARFPSLMPDHRSQALDSWRIRLIDGDTFAYGTERIRIRGFDAPEKSESGGFEASQRLDLLLREGPVTVVPQALDKYGRTVADVFVNNQNVAEVLKDEGYAKQGESLRAYGRR